MIKKIALGLVAVVVLFVGFVATRPANYRVTRTVTVTAPPDVVRAQIVDFKKWRAWSPWDKLDPKQTSTYGGPETGKDATYAWSGNDDVGEGNMKILGVTPERVDVDLNFIRPFKSHSTVDFTLKATGAATEVTWGMDGTNDFMGKLFCVFVDMDQMLGKDFMEGLTALKKVSEEEATKAAAPPPAAPAAEPVK